MMMMMMKKIEIYN